MNEMFNNNGYGYVDLGLPSKTLWATCNVGADNPSDFGLYFQWGDVKGCTKGQIGRDKAFSLSTYKWSVDGIDSNFSKYNTVGDTLDLEDDAANIHMGGDWHMPTPEQIRELIENTTTTWTRYNGVIGLSFMSKRDILKDIFFPIAGCVKNGSLRYFGSEGYIWSSELSKNNIDDGQNLNITSEGINVYENHRSLGFPVRGVIDKHPGLSELIKNEIKDNFKVKVTSLDYRGNIKVELLYNGEIISSDTCQVRQ